MMSLSGDFITSLQTLMAAEACWLLACYKAPPAPQRSRSAVAADAVLNRHDAIVIISGCTGDLRYRQCCTRDHLEGKADTLADRPHRRGDQGKTVAIVWLHGQPTDRHRSVDVCIVCCGMFAMYILMYGMEAG